MKDYITLNREDYIGIEVEAEIYPEITEDDVDGYIEYILSNSVEKTVYTDKPIEEGDTVSIYFRGECDGVEFESGSNYADSSPASLVIGSGSFIDGFEDKLIGVKIGDTVDLNLTFPENYGNAELNGKAVVFTVKVNHVTTKNALKPEAYYEKLGYKTVEEYYTAVKERTFNKILLTKVLSDSKVNKYPKAEKEMIIEQGIEMFKQNLQQYYGSSVTLKDYLSANGQTEDEFNEYVATNYAEPLMEEEMVIYAIFDDAGFKMDKKEIADFTKKEVASYKSDKITEKSLKEQYGEDYFEYLYIQEKVVKYLNDNAKIS
jgi:trigger factor